MKGTVAGMAGMAGIFLFAYARCLIEFVTPSM